MVAITAAVMFEAVKFFLHVAIRHAVQLGVALATKFFQIFIIIIIAMLPQMA